MMAIRGGTAVWVLAAHAWAVLIPLVLVIVILRHQAWLAITLPAPQLLWLAVALMITGSLAEVLQNSRDDWYLTPDTASANGISLVDGVFFACVAASQSVLFLAFSGLGGLQLAAAVVPLAVFPLLYWKQKAPFAVLGITGALAAGSAFWQLGDPLVLIPLILPAATMYFFGLLLSTGAQVLHGFTTLAASSGVVFLALGISQAAKETPTPWWVPALLVVLTGAALMALRSRLAALPRTPRAT